ncbi:MAG: DUF4040 domain-containing protein [Treponema sp.]|nr:DUF4040 domain-containing protein [Treponema sp.]
MMPIEEAVLLSFLVVSATAVCIMRRMLGSMIIFASFGIVMSLVWILLASPDLAITEAAVGTGISGILFFVVLKRIGIMEEEHRREREEKSQVELKAGPDRRSFYYLYNAFSALFCLCFILVLLMAVSHLPPFGDPANPTNNELTQRYIEQGLEETGAINIVAGVLLDYRAFDTYGESLVLFTAVAAILLLLHNAGPLDAFDAFLLEMEEPRTNVILQTTASVLVAMIMIFGFYVIFFGHLGPGGGFSGGAILGSSLALYASAYGTRRARFFTYAIFRRIIACSLFFYAIAKGYSIFTGANHISSGIALGTPGRLFSAGLILPLNIAVGLIVASTLYVIYILFSREEFH